MPVVQTIPSLNLARRPWPAGEHIGHRLPAWAALATLSALCGVLFFYGLNQGELWGTESLRAAVAAEMLRTGDWVVPHLHGQPLLSKPPGMYWAIALCSLPFGQVSEWTARLPSALAATATVFLVYWYFGRQLGRAGGLGAALIVPMSPLWLEKASAADIDMLQVFWTTASILFLLRAVEGERESRNKGEQESGRGGEQESRRAGEQENCWAGGLSQHWCNGDRAFSSTPALLHSRSPALLHSCSPPLLLFQRWWLLALLCVAGGFLTKWTTPAFFYAAALPLLWWRGQWRLLVGRRHLVALGVAVAVSLAWVTAALAQVGGEAFAAMLRQEAFHRLIPAYEGRPYSWPDALLHPLRVLQIGLPFSPLALVTLWPRFWDLWDERGQFLLAGLHCWTWPNLLLWSLPAEHKPRFSFPLLPGLSGLAAMVVVAWLAGRLPWRLPRLRPRHLLVATLAVWLLIKVALAQGWIEGRNVHRAARQQGQLLAQLVPADEILYLLGIKEDAVLFYFGRSAQALTEPGQLPDGGRPAYCLASAGERDGLAQAKRFEQVQAFADARGATIFLLRVSPR